MEGISHHDCRWSRPRIPHIIFSLLLLALLWRPALAAPNLTAADYYVHSLPGAPDGPLLKMHAGHIEVNESTHGNLFFWLFHNRHLADKSRTIIWLNGGPGCSSMDGALMEVGPYRVRKEGKLEYNNGSWDEFANLLFIDQPVGTGFSYVDTNAYLTELDQMADQMVVFLEKFFALFPEYGHDDIYMAGESYAGQHIPYIASHILARNKQKAPMRTRPSLTGPQGITGDETWNLKGLLIGNGWISGPDQYPSYLQFAYKNNLLSPGSSAASSVETQQTKCEDALKNGEGTHVDTEACESILQEILQNTVDDSARENQRCYNMYDVRLRDSYSSCGMNWPPDLTEVTPYLRRSEVKTALHVDTAKQTGWTECAGAVSGAFKARNSDPSVNLLPDLLSEVPIVLFSGDKDLICNHVGTENLIHNLEWNGGKGFELSPGMWAPKRQWTFESEPAGMYQSARNLTYLLFYNASHMVPFDYPRRTRDMLDRFMGVDIGSTGGAPVQSLIDGEQAGLETSVAGHPNSTAASEAEKGKLKEAEQNAYYRSGEVALVFVVIAAGVWGWWVWRERRRRRALGYAGVRHDDEDDDGAGPSPSQVVSGFRDAAGGAFERWKGPPRLGVPPAGRRVKGGWNSKRQDGRSDLEAADFDESRLDDLTPNGEKRYDLADDEESSDEGGSGSSRGRQANGKL